MKRPQARSLYAILLFAGQVLSCQGPGDPLPTMARTDSLKAIEPAVAMDSTNAKLWQQLYQDRLGKADTSGALAALRQYTKLEPGNTTAWLDLAWLLADRKDPATVALTDSLSLLPDTEVSTRASYIRGVYHSNVGMDSKAIAVFDSIITVNYTFIDAYIEKGIILHDQKRFAEALKTFQQALLINSKNAELYYWISRCHEGLGNGAEAEDWIRKYEALRQQ